ncbi:hypothetical protein BARBAKC583_0304 [Bartonella bacilliformis KC583]|uniref:Uncharacterized protein n=1 Tax=Bartonella bacilliformis (strain ATCC 35685 / KC583 / Herrer 020/F12,63) TaxID=360095 RepID=A1URM2_BARBK|nr:hypothetical protein BARBAKC583_0304 [Bartonella bacilliformis KC583]
MLYPAELRVHLIFYQLGYGVPNRFVDELQVKLGDFFVF